MGEPCSTLRLMPYPPCGDGRPGSWDRGQREGVAKIIPCPLPIREQFRIKAKLTVKFRVVLPKRSRTHRARGASSAGDAERTRGKRGPIKSHDSYFLGDGSQCE